MRIKLNSMVRPVLALLVIGIIVGLFFLYHNVDKLGNVSADGGGGDNEIVENDNTAPSTKPDIENKPSEDKPSIDGDSHGEPNKPTTPPSGGDIETEKPSEEMPKVNVELPRTFRDGAITLGAHGTKAHSVYDFMGGYLVVGTTTDKSGDFVTTEKCALVVGFVRGDSLEHIDMMDESSDLAVVGASIGSYGIAVVAESEDAVYVYRYNFDLERVARLEIGGASAARLAGGENFALIYKVGDGYVLDSYRDDFAAHTRVNVGGGDALVSVYGDGVSGYEILFANGDVVFCDGASIVDKKNIGVRILEAAPFIDGGKIKYAIIGVKDSDRSMYIFDNNWNMVGQHYSGGNKILFIDKLYTYNSVNHVLDVYCTCGEYTMSIKSDISSVSYIDYYSKMFYYIDSNGDYRMASIDNGKIESKIAGGYTIFADKSISVQNNGGIVIIRNQK